MDLEISAKSGPKSRQIVRFVVEVKDVDHNGKEMRKVEPSPGVD